jgi:hypothetical protein
MAEALLDKRNLAATKFRCLRPAMGSRWLHAPGQTDKTATDEVSKA